MDNTEKKVVDFMLHNTYTDVIHRSITGFLAISFKEIQNSLKIDANWLAQQLVGHPTQVHHQIIAAINNEAFLAVLNSEKGKSGVIHALNETIKKKGDIINQIMLEFSINTGSDSNYIFDQMSRIFDICSKRIRVSIQQSKWKELYERWKDV